MEQLAGTKGGEQLTHGLADAAVDAAVADQFRHSQHGDSDVAQEPERPGNTEHEAQEQERPQSETERRTLARVYVEPERRTVSMFMDEVTANTVIYAVRLMAADAEAHAREVRVVGAALPAESYGAANRARIAIRHERVAARLRVVERSYRGAAGGQ